MDTGIHMEVTDSGQHQSWFVWNRLLENFCASLQMPRTYWPDNEQCTYAFDGKALAVRPPPEVDLQKEVTLEMDASSTHVRVIHRITNTTRWDITLAPWALSVMRHGGAVVIPQEPFVGHSERLLPIRPVASVIIIYTFVTMRIRQAVGLYGHVRPTLHVGPSLRCNAPGHFA